MATKTFGGIKYSNGSVPSALLAEIEPKGKHGSSNQAHAFLRRDAADAWNRAAAEVKAETGITLTVRGWNRTLAEQEKYFFERYERRAFPYSGPFNDVRWYKGRRYVRMRGAAAAIPGNSNHGWGLAVDIEDFGSVGQWNNPRYLKAWPILRKHGWTETEGRGRIQEPWHKVYDPAQDRGKTESDVRVTTARVNMRETPNGRVIGTLPKGFRFRVKRGVSRSAGGYVWIQSRAGKWIAAKYTKKKG